MNVNVVPKDHNETPTEDAILVVQLSKLAASQDRTSSQTGSHRAVVKDTESKGLSPRIAKEALSIKRSGKAAEKLEELQTLLHYLRLLGVELPTDQLDLFAEIGSAQPVAVVDRATEDGLRAGRMGEPIEACPHDASTDAYRSWRDAYQIGEREREQILAMPVAPLFRPDGSDDDEPEDVEFEGEDA